MIGNINKHHNISSFLFHLFLQMFLLKLKWFLVVFLCIYNLMVQIH